MRNAKCKLRKDEAEDGHFGRQSSCAGSTVVEGHESPSVTFAVGSGEIRRRRKRVVGGWTLARTTNGRFVGHPHVGAKTARRPRCTTHLLAATRSKARIVAGSLPGDAVAGSRRLRAARRD